MKLRLGLFARLAAVIAITLMVIQILLVWIYVRDRADGDDPGYRFPLPNRVVAIVELIEASDDPTSTLIAVNGPDLRVDIVGSEAFDVAGPDVSLAGLEERFADYASVFGERPFAIFVDIPDDMEPSELRSGDTTVWTRFPMRVLVGLSDGRVVSIETRDDLLTQVYSVPIGWFSGIFGVIASLIVLFFVRRETKPIETLARAIERFGKDGTPSRVASQGAPELRSLIQNFNGMQVRIADLMERQSVMLGALGHDLRTYLTRLSLRVEEVPDQQRLSMQSNIEKISAIVESSLDFARGGATGDIETVDLPAFLADWVAERNEARVALGATAAAHVDINATALERVLGNLVENGLKFGTTVEIECSAIPPTIRILDDGPGLPEADLTRVLEPFVTLDDARTADRSGTGLGLAIANLLVRDAGGRLELSNWAPTGLCAAVVLPAAD